MVKRTEKIFIKVSNKDAWDMLKETSKNVTDIKELLAVLSQDFKDHSEEDDKRFNGLYWFIGIFVSIAGIIVGLISKFL